MFGISFEHILIVGVILIFIGPRRLPELGNTMGKAIKNFKDSISGIEEASFKKLEPKPLQEKPIATPVAQADALSRDPASNHHMSNATPVNANHTKTTEHHS